MRCFTIRTQVVVAVLMLYALLALNWIVLRVQFESNVLNEIAIVILSTLPVFLVYQVIHIRPKRAGILVLKVACIVVLALFFLISVILSVFDLVALSTEELHRVSVDQSRDIVVNRSSAGATTDLWTSIGVEKRLGIGLQRYTVISDIEHLRDVELEKRADGTIVINSLEFTALKYERQYYVDGGTLKEGQIIWPL